MNPIHHKHLVDGVRKERYVLRPKKELPGLRVLMPRLECMVRAASVALLAVVVSSTAQTSPAQAKKQPFMDFQIVTNKFGVPNMVYHYKNGKYVWDGKSTTTGFRLKARGTALIGWQSELTLTAQGIHGTPEIIGKIPDDKKYIDHSDSITFPNRFLAAYAPNFVDFCERNGTTKKVVKDGFVAMFRAQMVDKKLKRFNDTVKMPMRVVCMPKPKSTNTNLVLGVKKLKLYTVPAKPKCGELVRMVAEIHTNLPGKVDFKYYRDNGDHRDGSVTTTKGGSGYVKRWSTKYRFNETINRKYKVVLMGHKEATPWVPLKVNCGAKSGQKGLNGIKS